MAVKTVQVLGNLTPDTSRGPSPAIWGGQGAGNGWVADFQQDPRIGLDWLDDFKSVGLSPATGSAANFIGEKPWYAFLNTNGVIKDSGIVGGGINLSASTSANQGVSLGSLNNSFQIITSGGAYQGRLAFETRVQVSTGGYLTGAADVFIGLVDTTTTTAGLPAAAAPITGTGGTLSASGLIGFHKRGGSSNFADFNFVYNVAAGTPVYPTNLTTLIGSYNLLTTGTATAPVAGTFYKLGFVYDPGSDNTPRLIGSASTGQTAGTVAQPTITVYVNGIALQAFLTTTNVGGASFPVTLMSPAIAFKQQGGTSITVDVDFVRVAQQLIA